MLDIQHLTKTYGEKKAVDDLTLHIAPGEIYGFIGHNGAGKTTTLKSVVGILQFDQGEITIGGKSIKTDPLACKRLLAYIPDNPDLYEFMKGIDYLNFIADVFGIPAAERWARIEPYADAFELTGDLGQPISAYSHGMKQKLALSCALIHRPRLLLLDEPTTGVDAVSRSEFWDMLYGLREQGISIMVSTSYMDEASRCERIAMISGGRILRTDTPARLVAALDENLWNAEASDMYRLLSAVRSLPDVKECYTFGATLHVVATPFFNADEAMHRLAGMGIADAKIYPAQGNIEDLFIKLMGND